MSAQPQITAADTARRQHAMEALPLVDLNHAIALSPNVIDARARFRPGRK